MHNINLACLDFVHRNNAYSIRTVPACHKTINDGGPIIYGGPVIDNMALNSIGTLS